jgi:hypothetical protein
VHYLFRREDCFASIEMLVRLTKKLAERIDGVDLSANEPGDMLDLPPSEGRLLLAEGWAIIERRRQHSLAYRSSGSYRSSTAADRRRTAEFPGRH